LCGSVGLTATAFIPTVSRANESQQEEPRAYVRCGKMCQVELRHYYLSQAQLNSLQRADV